MIKFVSTLATAWLLLAHQGLAEIATGGSVDDENLSVVYESDTGNLSIDTAGKTVAVLELVSESSLFQYSDGDLLKGLFDVNSPQKIFKLAPEGWTVFRLEKALPPNQTAEAVAKDLSVDGSYLEGGAIRNVDLVMVNGEESKVTPTSKAEAVPPAYAFHLTEFSVSPALLPRLVAVQSIGELEAIENGLVKAGTAKITRKMQSSIRPGESTTITTTRSAVRTPDSRRAARGMSISQSNSVTLHITAKDGNTVGVQLAINTGSPVARAAGKSKFNLASYIETELDKPVAMFGASGNETKVILLTITKR